MSRLYRNNTEVLHDRTLHLNPANNKSPIRRQTIHNMNPARSPLRSRTPTRCVSPLKQTQPPVPIKFITTVSPGKQRQTNLQNYSEFSNGNSIKYIHQNLIDKNYQNSKKKEFNKKTERNTQEDNRLFGKLVNKLNSEKKAGLKSNECSYKTSAFADNSDHKHYRMEQTSTKNESGVIKQLFNQFKANETKNDSKSTSKQKDNPIPLEESQGLSCLVYKMKNNYQSEIEQIKQQRGDRSKSKDNSSANTPSILLKKRMSKAEEDLRKDGSPLLKKKSSGRLQEEQKFTDFNLLLTKIEQEKNKSAKILGEELVKMSFKVQQSMNMDPFI